MDQLFTTQFWHDQLAVILSAPWIIVPSLLIAGFIGWKWKGINDDGEIRGLRAQTNAAGERLELARERYEAVVKQVSELRAKLVEQDGVIAGLKGVATVRVDRLVATNTEIQGILTGLSTSTSSLGQALSSTSGSG
jgi:hypothetical protein